MGKKGMNIGLGLAALAASAAVPGSAFAWGRLATSLGLMAVGGLVSSQQTVQGQKLSSLDVTLDAQGAPIVKFWGWGRVAPRLVWSSGLLPRTEKHRSSGGGKGGPKVEETEYGVKLLYEVCLGPLTRPERIKLNSTVLYDWNGGGELGAHLVFADGVWSGETDSQVKIRWTPGTLDQPVDEMLEVAKGVGNWTAYPQVSTLALEIHDVAYFGGSIPTLTVEGYNSVTALGAVIEEIASWVEMEPLDFDLRQLEGISVAPTQGEGFMADTEQSAAELLMQLSAMYDFDWSEVDGVLRAVRHPHGAVVTLNESELRVRAGYGGGERAKLERPQSEEDDRPQITEVTVRNPNRENYPDSRDARRDLTRSQKRSSVSFSAQMKGGRSAGLARTIQAQEWASAEGVNGNLGVQYLYLAAGDEVNVRSADGIKEMVLTTATAPMFGSIAAKLVGFDPLVFGLPLPADTGGFDRNVPATHGAPVSFVCECPFPPSSAKAFTSPAFLMAFAPLAGDQWRGALVNVDRRFSGGDWKEISEFTYPRISTIGELTAPYSPSLPQDGYLPDAQLSCKTFGGGDIGSLYSATGTAAAEEGANLMLFETGVGVSYVIATLTSTVGGQKFYTLSNLKGGRNGSDDLIDGEIPTGTRFVMLSDEVGHFEEGPLWFDNDKMRSSIGADFRLRVNAPGTKGPQITVPLGTFGAHNVQMPSPSIYKATRLPNGDFHLKGLARTRRAEDNLTLELTQMGDIGAPRFAQGYKYSLTLEGGGLARTLIQYTADDRGSFDWTLTASELHDLFGTDPGELTGTLAIYGPFGIGRHASFAQTEE